MWRPRDRERFIGGYDPEHEMPDPDRERGDRWQSDAYRRGAYDGRYAYRWNPDRFEERRPHYGNDSYSGPGRDYGRPGYDRPDYDRDRYDRDRNYGDRSFADRNYGADYDPYRGSYVRTYGGSAYRGTDRGWGGAEYRGSDYERGGFMVPNERPPFDRYGADRGWDHDRDRYDRGGYDRTGYDRPDSDRGYRGDSRDDWNDRGGWRRR
ncbi:MAG TPA: hypothetical protein VF824_10905 [Thermoanaerobaculia bacterium]